jgi:hypothetical protein
MKQELVGGTTYGHANPDDVPGASMTASRFIRANGTTTKCDGLLTIRNAWMEGKTPMPSDPVSVFETINLKLGRRQ